MKIPKFSGKYTEWETYRDLFITVIHNSEKFFMESVHGKALEIVSKYKLSEANYKLAYDDLGSNYSLTREQLIKFINAHLVYLEAYKSSFKEIKTSTPETKKGVLTHQSQAKIVPDYAQTKINKKKHCSCCSKEHSIFHAS